MAKTITLWTIDDVAARFSDAVHTSYRLPAVRFQGYPWVMAASSSVRP